MWWWSPKPSIFNEKVGVIDLSLLKFKEKDKKFDVTTVKNTGEVLTKGSNTVDFSVGDDHLFKLVFDYDDKHRSGIITAIKATPESNIDSVIATILDAWVFIHPYLANLRTGFGDTGKSVDILSSNSFPSLTRIQITSLDKKSIAITKSISKLQESFTDAKFSLTRLT